MPWASLVSGTRAIAHRVLGGVSVTAGAVSGTGLLDQNSELVIDGQVISVDYALTCATALFGSLQYGDAITIAGASYTVRHEPMRLGDGSDCIVPLMLNDVVIEALGTNAGAFLVTLDGRYLRVSTTATAGEAIGTNTGAFVVTLDGRYLRVS